MPSSCRSSSAGIWARTSPTSSPSSWPRTSRRRPSSSSSSSRNGRASSRGSAAAFLTANGVILFAAEYLRRRAPGAEARARELERRPETDTSDEAEKRLATLGFREAVGVGTAQAAALFPGVSRAGVTIGGGLFVGLTHEDAARYAFLLATPIIGAAALLKLPDLIGHNGDGVRMQALVGALCAAAAAWVSIRFLMRYFQTNTLTPFAVYCLFAGLAALLVFVF